MSSSDVDDIIHVERPDAIATKERLALAPKDSEVQDQGCIYTWGRFVIRNWGMLFISLVFIFLTAAQTVSLPLWAYALAQGTGNHFSGPYVILLYTSFALAVCNGVASLLCWILFRFPSSPPFCHNFLLYLAVGLSLAVNGLVLVYAALPNRTPEMLQALLLNTGFIFSIPASKFLVEEKSKYRFCSWKPIISIGCVVWGVVISLIPLILEVIYRVEPVFTSTGGIIWSVIFMLSVAPGAISNVFMERFLKRQVIERKEKRNHVFDVLILNFWSTSIQVIIIASCFWLDIIPVIGFSKSLPTFSVNFKATSECLFGSNLCPTAWWLGLVFVASFLFQNISGTFLSADSANFVSIAQTLQVPLSTLFWIIFPNLNTSSFVTPISYVIPAMLLLLFGSILWKVWESQEKERLAKVWDYSINYFM